jgi:hypothetical protein
MAKTVKLVKVPNMPEELHREIKARAVREGSKIGDYIIKVLQEHVKGVK